MCDRNDCEGNAAGVWFPAIELHPEKFRKLPPILSVIGWELCEPCRVKCKADGIDAMIGDGWPRFAEFFRRATGGRFGTKRKDARLAFKRITEMRAEVPNFAKRTPLN